MRKALALLGLVGAILGGFWAAWHAGYAASEAAAARAVAQARQRASAVSNKIETRVSAALAHTEANRQVIHDLIPIYVPEAADRQCVVGVGAIELLNAAAEDRAPRPLAVPAETPSDTPLHTVVDTEADNLGVCNEWRAQLIGWQDWYAGVRASFGLPPLDDSETVSRSPG